MKTIIRKETYQATSKKSSHYPDNLVVSGIYRITSSSMMGSKHTLQYFSSNHTGSGTAYRLARPMKGVKMDFTVPMRFYSLLVTCITTLPQL